MNIPFLDLSRLEQDLKERLKIRFSEVLDSGVFSGGKEVHSLELSISDFLKSKHSLACANGTDALELALRALGIGSGDEVIVPAMTWVSTAEAVVLVGAKPVFWDVDEQGLLREDWEKAVTKKTKAVIPVHLYGKMVEMKGLIEKAKALKVYVVEDAAQSFGAFLNGKSSGTWGDIGCLSFYPTKNLGALGEAGMCLTQEDLVAEKIKFLLNHGQPVRDQHEIVGRNSRIDTIQAAFLNVFLEDFYSNQAVRKKQAKAYLEGLESLEGLRLPEGILEESHNAHLFVVQTPRRDEFRAYLSNLGIGTAIHYPTIVPDMAPYRSEGDFSQARRLAGEGLSLPLNPFLKPEEQVRVIEAIRTFFEGVKN